MKQVIVICGPTASGKTSLSIKLAKHYQLDVINGDSVQIFKGYNIGSAKIKDDDMQGITHHLINIKDANETYDVSKFQKDVRQLIHQQSTSMIVGGTGLYIKAALYDYHFYEESNNEIIDFPSEEMMIKTIYEADPNASFDHKNLKRVKRMYQKVMFGHKPSENIHKDKPLFDILTLYLDIPRDILKKRIIQRLEEQIDQGFIEEVQHLSKHGSVKDVIGYREIQAYLNQKMTLEEAKTQIVKKSMAFAKRQKTWFMNQMHPIIIDGLSKDILEKSIKEIDAWKK
jgi:tRNA dimethylallyltransferase